MSWRRRRKIHGGRTIRGVGLKRDDTTPAPLARGPFAAGPGKIAAVANSCARDDRVRASRRRRPYPFAKARVTTASTAFQGRPRTTLDKTIKVRPVRFSVHSSVANVTVLRLPFYCHYQFRL